MSWSNDTNLKLDISVKVGEMRGLMDDLGLDSKNDDLLLEFIELMGNKLTSSYGDNLIYYPIEEIINGRMGLYDKEELKKEVEKEYEQSKWTEEQWNEYWENRFKKKEMEVQ